MSSLVTYVLQVSSTLLVFGAVAAALVRFGRRPGRRREGPLEVLDRLHLEGRRVVYLVRAGERVLVVGGSEAGLTPLGELDASSLPSGALQRASVGSDGSSQEEGSCPPEDCVERGSRVAGGALSR